MERNDDVVVELGVASVETRGAGGVAHEEVLQIKRTGLSDD